MRHRADMREIVQRHGNPEVVFEFAHQLEHLQGVESEIGEQLIIERRLDRTSADAFEDVNRLVLKTVE